MAAPGEPTTFGGLPLTSLYVHERGMRPSGTSDPVARRSTPLVRCHRRLLPLLGPHRLNRMGIALPLRFQFGTIPIRRPGRGVDLSHPVVLHECLLFAGPEMSLAVAGPHVGLRRYAALLTSASSLAHGGSIGLRPQRTRGASASRNQLPRPAAAGVGTPDEAVLAATSTRHFRRRNLPS
jgi:hypothetical protein